jgi:hypothetical protein
VLDIDARFIVSIGRCTLASIGPASSATTTR